MQAAYVLQLCFMKNKGGKQLEETRDDVILEKNYTNRDTLKKDLVKYMLNIWNKGTVEIVMNELEKEVKRKFVEDIAEAMIEDAEVSDYARCIWDEYTFDCEEQDDKCSWGCMNQNKINVLDTGVIMETVISQISDEDSIFYKYTYRYSLPKEDDYQTIDVKRFKEVLHEILNDMNIQIKPTLYQQAYPVFWLEALNMQFSRKRKKQVCFKQPIEQESDKEKYLFALLLEKRAKNTVRNNIFSGVKRELSKYLNSNLDLDESWNRWIYIKMFRDKMGSDVEKTKQKREKSFKEQLEKKAREMRQKADRIIIQHVKISLYLKIILLPCVN